MSASGVKPDDTVLQTYDSIKLKRAHTYAIFALTPDNKAITTLPNSVEKKDLVPGEEFEAFLKELPEKEPRWAVYDMEYDQGEGKRNKLCFIMWTPDEAPIKQKMLYASSKDAIRRALIGIAADLQANSYDDITKQAVLDKINRR